MLSRLVNRRANLLHSRQRLKLLTAVRRVVAAVNPIASVTLQMRRIIATCHRVPLDAFVQVVVVTPMHVHLFATVMESRKHLVVQIVHLTAPVLVVWTSHAAWPHVERTALALEAIAQCLCARRIVIALAAIAICLCARRIAIALAAIATSLNRPHS